VERISTLPDLPPRPPEAHKGTFGHVLVIAGSRGMSGAATLAGRGALRGGAGLVSLAVPEGLLPIVAAAEPSYLTLPLPEDAAGKISAEGSGALLARAGRMDAVAIGPGLGQSKGLRQLTALLYTELWAPLVVDADALNLLSAGQEPFARHNGPRVLTPHPGEFARMTRSTTADIQSRRLEVAASFAAAHQVVLVLKGAGTIITDGSRYRVNTTGNSGMATGGSGDVLTGLITSLLGQGMDPFSAACLGVHVHGLAGDLAAAELTGRGLIASDLPDFLPKAWRQLE
jgi:NAD(P)H-hydrate epimerase